MAGLPQKRVKNGTMSYYFMKEKWTPLKFVGIKLYVTEERDYFIKVWNQRRKRINL